MASLTKSYDKQKLLGKVYTPFSVVEKILDEIGYHNVSILGKTILDPACGDGRFLSKIVERIIKFSSLDNLQENLEKVYGWDIDEIAVRDCIANLNKLVAPLQIQVNWNIYVCNSLQKILEQNTTKFDFIIGNPPYIRIQHLSEKDRKFIQNFYKFCKTGSTDIYIAFFELCYFLLKEEGICGLITPNTFLYSETAKFMRSYFAHKQNVIKIINYTHTQLFENATTYSAISIFGKKPQQYLLYEQTQDNQNFQQFSIDFGSIKNQKIWNLSLQSNSQRGVKLKDICKIHVGITTLCDKAYIFTIKPLDDEYVLANTFFKGQIKIEKAILKPIIKASKLKSSQDIIYEYILFPYEKINGKHQIIDENKLRLYFPLAYEYLLSIKAELDKRDNGKPNPVAWYAFGRSQGLDSSFGKKIIFSPMNKKPNFILVENEEATFYSGYCIKYEGDYEFLLKQLNSDRFAEFIAASSRDFRNGWKAYNKKVVEEFIIIDENDSGRKIKPKVELLSLGL
ncbi:MAG: N-6 DNA methylase [Raineya sp.]|nr:SAM-dependent methyltransferase [Raineya sp.]MDW8295569.1 N-6 DNA methylase [Raineya sp.]